MRTLLVTGALCATIGAGVAWVNAADYYNNKAAKLAEVRRVAEQERQAIADKETQYYAKKYLEALNVEPVTTVERVHVKASCVRADPSVGVDNDTHTGRVELGDAANRGFREVARRAESQYRQCAAQLGAAQALLRVIR